MGFVERTRSGVQLVLGSSFRKFPSGEQEMPDSIQNADQRATHKEDAPCQQVNNEI
jgi:hypothetical protein